MKKHLRNTLTDLGAYIAAWGAYFAYYIKFGVACVILYIGKRILRTWPDGSK